MEIFILNANTTLVMDTRRCLEILEIESVTSPEELKQAYRDMVQIWHPDRFHGNARLEQIAGEKLREINYAYEHLLAYFDPDHSKRLRTSNTPSPEKSSNIDQKPQPDMFTRAQTGNFSSTRDHSSKEKTDQFDSIRVYPVARKSSLGRYVLFGFFCVFLAGSGLLIYFSQNMDKITSKSLGLASQAMEKLKNDVVKDIATRIKAKGGTQEINFDKRLESQESVEEFKPVENEKYFEIHLDSGTIIMTESWWEDDNMVMYRQYGGSMGIEKARVKKIVER